MELWRLRTCLFLVAPLLMMLFSVTLSTVRNDSSIDVDEIVDSIHKGIRKVLLLTPTPLSMRVLVIVSSQNSSFPTDLYDDKIALDDGAIVFDQPLSTLTDGTMQLTNSAQFFTNKWTLPPNATSVSILCDSTDEYLGMGLGRSDDINDLHQLQLINLKTGAVFYQSLLTVDMMHFTDRLTITMADGPDVYSFSNGFFPGSFGKGHLYDTGLLYSSLYQLGTGNLQILYDTAYYYNPWADGYQKPWYISAGYITDWSVILVEATSLSIIKFDKSFLPMKTREEKNTFSYTNTSFATYWIKPPVTPPTDPTNSNTSSPNPNTTSSHSGKDKSKLLVYHHGKLALIIIIGVVLGSLFIAALVYLLRKCATNAKIATEQALAATEKIPKGDGKGGSRSKIANRKSSKRSGKGRASRGATASKVENGQQGGALHEPTLLIAHGEEQEPVASNQKIIKLSRRGSSRKIVSKHPASSGKVPSTRRSSLGRHSSVQRRASSGKVASGRRSTLKRQGGSKGRTASGKVSSHGFSSGKAATPQRVASGKAATPQRASSGKAASPHRPSSKRKSSIKRTASGKAASPHHAASKRQASGKHRASGKAASPRHAASKPKGSIKRRASGKAASPHHAASKRKGSIKQQASGKRRASGKRATPRRVASGKAATPRHAASKRKGSIKRRTSGKAAIPGTKR